MYLNFCSLEATTHAKVSECIQPENSAKMYTEPHREVHFCLD